MSAAAASTCRALSGSEVATAEPEPTVSLPPAVMDSAGTEMTAPSCFREPLASVLVLPSVTAPAEFSTSRCVAPERVRFWS